MTESDPSEASSPPTAVMDADRWNVLLRRNVESRRKFPPRLRRQELALRRRLVRKDITITHNVGMVTAIDLGSVTEL